MKYGNYLIYVKIGVFTGKFDRGFMNELRSTRTQIYIKSKTDKNLQTLRESFVNNYCAVYLQFILDSSNEHTCIGNLKICVCVSQKSRTIVSDT